MKHLNRKHLVLIGITFTTIFSTANRTQAQGTAFSYQGRLTDSGSPATGNYDLVFTLHDAGSGGNQVGAAVTNAPVAINNGLFSGTLDFGGGIFDGTAYWLEIGVRTNGSLGVFATLSPRQALSATPYALYAANAGIATRASAVSPSAVTGAGLQDGAITAAKVAGGQVVKSLNGLTDNVTLSGGSNITLTSSGTSIQISASGSGSFTLPFSGSGASLDPIFRINNTGTGDGIDSSSPAGNGVRGESGDGWGIFGRSQRNIGAFGQTLANGAAGVLGRNDGTTGAGGQAVFGYAATAAIGVLGVSEGGDGVSGRSNGQGKSGVYGYTEITNSHGGYFKNGTSGPGLGGESIGGTGVEGFSFDGWGVFGRSQGSLGVFGQSLALFDGTGVLGRYDGIGTVAGGRGVYGYCATIGVGVVGISEGGDGVSGRSNTGGKSGVSGYTEINTSHGGYFKNGANGPGLGGESIGGTGVEGYSTSGWGLFGRSQSNIGAFGQTLANGAAGVLGRNDGPTGAGGAAVSGYASSGALGVLGVSEGSDGVSGRSNGQGKSGVSGYTAVAGSYGGSFYNAAAGGISLKVVGNATVDVLTILGGADVAEPFRMSGADIPKGAVVVIDEDSPGQLKISNLPYDTRVAGVVSGANGINPGISLNQQGVIEGGQNVALSGRVYVLADACGGAIRPGDLLTTSSTPGHAMKVADHGKAQGAILGKAMSGLHEGRGMVLVLVTLQ